MFFNCISLGSSGNLNAWNVSYVTDMSNMFNGASKFNQSLNSWDVSRVTNMNNMFYLASSFNQPLDVWNVSHVTDMSFMFCGANTFNQSIGLWNVSRVTNMHSMFGSAKVFNQPLDGWNVSQVIDMSFMFDSAFSFNQSLDSWNVFHVTDKSNMFSYALSFNQSLESWYVSHVTDMSWMFSNTINFNQPLNAWNISNVVDMRNMFEQISLSVFNYDQLLKSWSILPSLQNNVPFDAGGSQYSIDALDARNVLIKTFGWTISDGGLIPNSYSSNMSGSVTQSSFVSNQSRQLKGFNDLIILFGIGIFVIAFVICVLGLVVKLNTYHRSKIKKNILKTDKFSFKNSIIKKIGRKAITTHTQQQLTDKTLDELEEIIKESESSAESKKLN